MLSERLKLRRISVEKQPKIPSKSKRSRKRLMPPREPFDYTSFCPEDEALEAASIAMSRWNEISISNKGREYEFVEVTGSKRMTDPYIIHCNFIARPKIDIEFEPKLFFGEVKYSSSFKKDGEDGAIGCSVCCILGPVGTKTGLIRCCMCKMHRDLIQHPYDGDFTKGRTDALRKEPRRRKRATQNRSSHLESGLAEESLNISY